MLCTWRSYHHLCSSIYRTHSRRNQSPGGTCIDSLRYELLLDVVPITLCSRPKATKPASGCLDPRVRSKIEQKGKEARMLAVMATVWAGLTGSPSANTAARRCPRNGVRWPLFGSLSHHPLPSHVCNAMAKTLNYEPANRKNSHVTSSRTQDPSGPSGLQTHAVRPSYPGDTLTFIHSLPQRHGERGWKRSLLAIGDLTSLIRVPTCRQLILTPADRGVNFLICRDVSS